MPVDGDRVACFYFSHRDDLLSLLRERWFARDGSGLPLLGPVQIPSTDPARVMVDIWQQKDWAIVRGKNLFNARPDNVKMGEWREDYTPGRPAQFADGSGWGYFPYGDHREKEKQERWKGSAGLSSLPDLCRFGAPRGDPMWIGTLSALPSQKAKLLD